MLLLVEDVTLPSVKPAAAKSYTIMNVNLINLPERRKKMTAEGKVVELIKEPNYPRSMCPHCKKIMKVDITLFKDNASKILQSNCPYCGGTIFSGMLLLSHPELAGLMKCIQIVVETLNPGNKILA